jgi:hypothetical protein
MEIKKVSLNSHPDYNYDDPYNIGSILTFQLLKSEVPISEKKNKNTGENTIINTDILISIDVHILKYEKKKKHH